MCVQSGRESVNLGGTAEVFLLLSHSSMGQEFLHLQEVSL